MGKLEKCLLMHTPVKEGLSLESENGEDDGTGVDAGECVASREEINVSDDVRVVVVVTPKRNQRAHAQAVRIEYLKCQNLSI